MLSSVLLLCPPANTMHGQLLPKTAVVGKPILTDKNTHATARAFTNLFFGQY